MQNCGFPGEKASSAHAAASTATNAVFGPPADQLDRSRRVAVVGAGISGLLSAWLLKQAGHQVVLIEAARRVGGRIKTLRQPFSEGLHAEAGAMRIPAHHRLTLSLAAELGLVLVPFGNDCENAFVHLNGKRMMRGRVPFEAQRLGFQVDAHERGRSARYLFETAVSGFVHRNAGEAGISQLFNAATTLPPTGRQAFEHLDGVSLGSFMRLASGLSEPAADFVLALLGLEAHQMSSMAAIVADYREMTTSDTFWQIRGGMDKLTDAFVASAPTGSTHDPRTVRRPALGDDIVLDAKLIELSEERGCVHLRVESPSTRQQRSLGPFDRVIVSAPFSTLRHVRFNHLASVEKRRAIRRLHYDTSCKVLIEFDDCFWLNRTEAPILGGHSVTDLPIRSIHYPTLKAGDRPDRAVLLTSYTWANDSLRWTSLPLEDRIRYALRDLEEVHGLSRGSLDRSCRNGVSHSWVEQEFAAGAVAMFEPHQLSTLFSDVRRPEGPIHYCGEHTSERHGWIEGAIESAFRAVAEVCVSIDIEAGRHRAAVRTGTR